MDELPARWFMGLFRGQSGDREEQILSIDGEAPEFIPVRLDDTWFELFELHHWDDGQPVYYSCGFELQSSI